MAEEQPEQASLAGYLIFKPTGRLSVLRPQRKLWYVYNDEKCQLLYYKSESDSHIKSPTGFINLQQAAITLHLEEINHFIIHSDNKEYRLIAEDHESMMRWVVEIQKKRDIWNKQFEIIPKEEQFEQNDIKNSHESLPNEAEMHTIVERAKTAEENTKIMRVRSLPLDSTYQSPYIYYDRHYKSMTSIPQYSDLSSSIIQQYISIFPSPEDIGITSENRLRTYSVPEVMSINVPGEQPMDCFLPAEEYDSSVSSDSAIICTNDCHHTIRLQEMEQEIRITNKKLTETLCRESAYRSTMERLESMVEELEDRLAQLRSGMGLWWINAGDRTLVSFRKLEEKCQILKNHNAFLNDEVLKLSRMLQQEQYRQQNKEIEIRDMKNDSEQLKRDYVFLLLSSIRIYCTDGPETTEIYLYGGSRHKTRVLNLLDEARKLNNNLPTYESLKTCSDCYVDSMGFEHHFPDDSFILHYICCQLHLHYSVQIKTYQRHLADWNNYCRKQDGALYVTKELKYLTRKGIPNHLRKTIWRHFYRATVHDIMKDKGPYYYRTLVNIIPESQALMYHNRQISLDLLRTIPNNVNFSNNNAEGVRKLQEVLLAFCLHNPSLGYCQGMNFLVAMCLLLLEPEDAFWFLVAVTEKYFLPNYFDQTLIGAQADQEVLKDLIKEKMPRLYRHLLALDIDLRTITLNWFMAIFFDSVPFETLLRIWDCFLLEGPKVLFRFSLAILKMQEDVILKKQDTVSIMRQLKGAAKFCYDVDELIKTAFEDFRPFPRRSDFVAKQSYYTKALRDVLKRREKRKKSFADTLPELVDWKLTSSSGPHIDCAVVYDHDKLWLAYCNPNGSQIAKINVEESIMFRLNIQCESRVMCMYSAGSDLILVGTVSHVVQLYNTKTRKLLAEVRLNDSVLCLCFHDEDGTNLVYVGLADGTLAIIENICDSEKKTEVFYIAIGCSPISCLLELDRRLLCSCGNSIFILNSRTLDTIDQFHITSNDLDHISTLISNEFGIWVSVRGSSVLQVWDSNKLTCKLVYDIQHNTYYPHCKEDDLFCQPMRITAILPIDSGVIVGTSDGCMLVYNVTSSSRIISNGNSPYVSESIDEMLDQVNELSTRPPVENLSFASLPVTTTKNAIPPMQSRRQSAPVVSYKATTPSSPIMSHDSKAALTNGSTSQFESTEKETEEVVEKVIKRSSICSVELRQACGSYGLGEIIHDQTFVISEDNQYGSETESINERKRVRSLSTVTASSISFHSTEYVHSLELTLKEKINVSEKPIKCLLKVRCGDEVNILSCAGHYGDEDAVMKWTKEGEEMLWSSEPIVDVCPYTKPVNTTTVSEFSQNKLFSSSLISAAGPSILKTRKLSITTNTAENAGINKVQTLFSKFPKK